MINENYEHLWDVLIKQATISGLTDLVICSILVLAAWRIIVFVKQKTTPRKDLNKLIPADWHAEAELAWGVVVFIVMVVSVIVVFTLPGIVYAFTNPEY